MSDTPPPSNRGHLSRLEERIHRLEERVHQLSNGAQLSDYKHNELDKDFRNYEKHTQERMKWNTGMLLTFIGSILIPAIPIIVTILSKSDAPP